MNNNKKENLLDHISICLVCEEKYLKFYLYQVLNYKVTETNHDKPSSHHS